jgi:hypothetical protein
MRIVIFTLLALVGLISARQTLSAQNNCPNPADARVLATTPNSVSLAWQRTTGATVRVELYALGDTFPVQVAVTARLEATLKGLRPQTDYFYILRSDCDTIVRFREPAGFFRTPSVEYPCAYPVNVKVSDITETDAVVQWQKVTGATGYALEYRWTQASRWSMLPVTRETFAELRQLSPGLTYEVRVKSNCNGASSDYAPSVLFKTTAPVVRCDQPAVSVTQVETYSATLTWNLAMPEAELSYKKANDNTWFSVVLNQPAPYTLYGLEANTRYDIRLRQFCGNIASAYGTTFFTTQDDFTKCPMAEFSVGEVTSNSIQLNYTGELATLEISYRKAGGTAWKTSIVNTPNPTPTVTPFLIEDLEENTVYLVRMRRFCKDRFSDYAPVQVVTTKREILCNAPILSINQLKPTSAILGVDNQSLLYEIWYRNVNSVRWTVDFSSDLMGFTLDNLQSNQSYEVQVRNQCGNVYSKFSNIVRFTTPTYNFKCETPTVSIFDIQDRTAQFTWDVDLQGVEVSFKRSEQTEWTTFGLDNVFKPLFLDQLEPETSYDLRLRGICNGLYSDYSNVVTFTTTLDPTKCYAPIRLTANRITSSTVAIEWVKPPLVTRYQVEYRSLGTSRWVRFSTTARNGNFTLMGLRPNTAYELRMITLCPMDVQSPDTAEVTFQTLAQRMEGTDYQTSLSVYPNPVKDRLYLSGEDRTEPMFVTITDMMGKTVLHTNYNEGGLDVSGLPNGIYVLQAGSFIHRLIKE